MKKSLVTIILGLAMHFPAIVISQCSNSGVKNGSIFSSDNSIGSYPFGSPANAGLSDGNLSAATATITLFSGNTEYLKATGFGLPIPNGASICGIKVEVEKRATGISLFASIKDNSVRLVKAGIPTGSNYAKTSNWSSSSDYFTYGGVTDLWGTTWTRNDLTASNFGVVFSAEINGLVSLLPSAQIDHIRITAYFNIILPISITHFTAATGTGNTADITWAYTGEENNSTINIQRKSGSGEWTTLKTYKGEGLTPKRMISYTDPGCLDQQAYYRIEVVSAEGSPSYSQILQVQWTPGRFSIYPNPASNEINIMHSITGEVVYCTGSDGSRWRLPVMLKGSERSRLDIRHLPPGTYIINSNGSRGIFIKK